MSAASPALEIIDPGLQLTVQDLGRRGFEHEGVPRAGAADARSLAAANVLAGNAPDAAGLEATLLGPTLWALRDVTIALAGANLAPVALPTGRPLEIGRAHRLRAGELIECTDAGDPDRGCRLYIAIDGGIDVPVVLGSRSTSLVGRFGGFEGRPLRAGDVLSAGALAAAPDPGDLGGIDPGHLGGAWSPADAGAIHVLPGPAARERGGPERCDAFCATDWIVSAHSDRRGLRLETDDALIATTLAMPGDRASFGVVPGAIQLTPSGQPIVLMPDGGVTGGYPVLAVVATADLPTLGQLVPAATARFVAIR
jgi:antagonist of KipI